MDYFDVQKDDKGYGRTVEKAVEMKRAPVKELEKQKAAAKLRNTVLTELESELTRLKSFADKLYGYNSIINTKIINSGDPSVFTGSAERNAELGGQDIKVLQVATRHCITSRPVVKAEKIPAGEIILKASGKEFTLRFSGGNLAALTRAFKAHEEKISASIIPVDKSTEVLSLTSAKAGSDNRISLIEDTSGVFSFLEFFSKVRAASDAPLLSAEDVKGAAGVKSTAEFFELAPGARLTVAKPVHLEAGEKLVFTVNWRSAASGETPVEASLLDAADMSMKLGLADPIRLDELAYDPEMLKAFNGAGSSENPTAEEKKPQGPVFDDNFADFSWADSKEMKELSLRLDTNLSNFPSGEKRFEITAADFSSGKDKLDLDAVVFKNKNTSVIYSISWMVKEKPQISDPDWSPSHEAVPASNSIVEVMGVRMERPTDQIDDLLPGVKLRLKKASDETIHFDVERDFTNIEGGIINFVGQYNIVMELLNITLAPAGTTFDQLDEKRTNRVAVFYGEFSEQSLREKLMAIMTGAHPTSESKRLAMILQLGIKSVFRLSGANDINQWKMEMEEVQYKAKIRELADLLGEFFGRDSDRDNLLDSGLAWKMSELLRLYTARGSIIAIQRDANNRKITDIDKKIKETEADVETYRKKLVKDFSQLEGAQKEMEQMQKWMEQSQKGQ